MTREEAAYMRLIDADAACEKCGAKTVSACSDECVLFMGNLPTIDAVPVVRCRDCKYGWTHIYQTSAPALHCIKAFSGKEVDPMDFCSYGERKDGDTDGSA